MMEREDESLKVQTLLKRMSENEDFNPEKIFDYIREIELLGQIWGTDKRLKMWNDLNILHVKKP